VYVALVLTENNHKPASLLAAGRPTAVLPCLIDQGNQIIRQPDERRPAGGWAATTADDAGCFFSAAPGGECLVQLIT
jgi:hypothetical protein